MSSGINPEGFCVVCTHTIDDHVWSASAEAHICGIKGCKNFGRPCYRDMAPPLAAWVDGLDLEGFVATNMPPNYHWNIGDEHIA